MSSLGCIKFSTGSKNVLIINYLENKPKSKIHQGYKITMYSQDDNYKGGLEKLVNNFPKYPRKGVRGSLSVPLRKLSSVIYFDLH